MAVMECVGHPQRDTHKPALHNTDLQALARSLHNAVSESVSLTLLFAYADNYKYIKYSNYFRWWQCWSTLLKFHMWSMGRLYVKTHGMNRFPCKSLFLKTDWHLMWYLLNLQFFPSQWCWYNVMHLLGKSCQQCFSRMSRMPCLLWMYRGTEESPIVCGSVGCDQPSFVFLLCLDLFSGLYLFLLSALDSHLPSQRVQKIHGNYGNRISNRLTSRTIKM